MVRMNQNGIRMGRNGIRMGEIGSEWIRMTDRANRLHGNSYRMPKQDKSLKEQIIAFMKTSYMKGKVAPSIEKILTEFKTSRYRFYMLFPGKYPEVCKLANVPLPKERVAAAAKVRSHKKPEETSTKSNPPSGDEKLFSTQLNIDQATKLAAGAFQLKTDKVATMDFLLGILHLCIRKDISLEVLQSTVEQWSMLRRVIRLEGRLATLRKEEQKKLQESRKRIQGARKMFNETVKKGNLDLKDQVDRVKQLKKQVQDHEKNLTLLQADQENMRKKTVEEKKKHDRWVTERNKAVFEVEQARITLRKFQDEITPLAGKVASLEEVMTKLQTAIPLAEQYFTQLGEKIKHYTEIEADKRSIAKPALIVEAIFNLIQNNPTDLGLLREALADVPKTLDGVRDLAPGDVDYDKVRGRLIKRLTEMLVAKHKEEIQDIALGRFDLMDMRVEGERKQQRILRLEDKVVELATSLKEAAEMVAEHEGLREFHAEWGSRVAYMENELPPKDYRLIVKILNRGNGSKRKQTPKKPKPSSQASDEPIFVQIPAATPKVS